MTRTGVSNLVSIVMPAYNCEETIAESITSVVQQSYGNWELLIVDDKSLDGTLKVARTFDTTDGRIRTIPLSRNVGVANARNVGLAEARGRYIAFLDSDDLWLPGKLESQVQFMSEHGFGFSFTSYRKFERDGGSGIRGEIKAQPCITYHDLLKDNVIGCLTVMIDRRIIPVISMPQVKHEDFACWLQILKTGIEAHGLEQDLARYRVTAKSLSGQKKRSLVWRWQIYRKLERLSLRKSAWYFAQYAANAVYKRLRA